MGELLGYPLRILVGLHGISWDFNGISMGFQWDFTDFMGFRGISWDFNGISWDFGCSVRNNMGDFSNEMVV